MNNFMNSEEKIIKRLRNSAMSYLARYEVSEFQFKNTMKRKLSYFENNLNELEKDKLINQVKLEMVSSCFIDDNRYAETKIRSIRRQGGSQKLIFAKLNEKGISKDVIQSALNIVDEGYENPEIIAAVNFIKKKKIGVFYKNKKTNDEIDNHTLKDKWYGALARRGFSLEIVKKVLDIEDINNADLILEGNMK